MPSALTFSSSLTEVWQKASLSCMTLQQLISNTWVNTTAFTPWAVFSLHNSITFVIQKCHFVIQFSNQKHGRSQYDRANQRQLVLYDFVYIFCRSGVGIGQPTQSNSNAACQAPEEKYMDKCVPCYSCGCCLQQKSDFFRPAVVGCVTTQATQEGGENLKD